MGLFKDYVNQTRKPEGFLGKLMVFGMNGGHAKLADWGMSHLENITPASIAELGCGGGRNAAELMKRYPAVKTYGAGLFGNLGAEGKGDESKGDRRGTVYRPAGKRGVAVLRRRLLRPCHGL